MKSFCLLIIFSLLTLLTLSGCVTFYNPATGREELYLISSQEEIRLGEQVAYQTERQYQVVREPYSNQRLNSIGQRIVNACDRRDISYHFKIIDIPRQINAFAAPGGFIYVSQDLMNLADDDELAAVLGHELGHLAARHSVKKIQMNLGVALIESLIFKEKKMDEDLKQAKQITDTMINLVEAGYSREDELLADQLGVRYAYRAGFNPEGMITFLTKLQEKSEGREPGMAIFFHSHPPYYQRLEAIKNEISRLKDKEIK